MSDYITDPELLKQLNAGEKPTDEYVSDPALLQQLNQGVPTVQQQMLTAPPEAGADALTAIAPGAARPAVQAYWQGPAKGGIRDMAQMASILSQATPETAAELAKNPLEVAKAYVQGHPWYGNAKAMPARAAGFAGGLAGGMLAAPENAVMLPYGMAAYEQEKIRANPYAPGLQNNPYAQVQRGEATTQSRAGAANQMRTVANQPYGNVNQQERARLEQDRMMRDNIRKKAYERVMGPVAPGPMQ